MSDPLAGAAVVNTGINLPAAATAARLTALGATVSKIEPPAGDPLERAAPHLYAELTLAQTVHRLDLKQPQGREALHELLREADVLLTSSRPSALERMGLGRARLEERHPRLLHVAIVGHPAPRQELPGHDLTYLAPHGLLSPPALPRTLAADLAGAERAVGVATALLYARERGDGAARYAEVALADAAAFLALPHVHGLTVKGGILGGGDPYYAIYETADGWVALGALEPKFRTAIVAALGCEPGTHAFAEVLRTRPAAEWERVAEDLDIPLVAVTP